MTTEARYLSVETDAYSGLITRVWELSVADRETSKSTSDSTLHGQPPETYEVDATVADTMLTQPPMRPMKGIVADHFRAIGRQWLYEIPGTTWSGERVKSEEDREGN